MTHDRPHRLALGRRGRSNRVGEMVRAGRSRSGRRRRARGGGRDLARAASGLPAGLSDREVEVLRLIAQARTNREIARALQISKDRRPPRRAHLREGRRLDAGRSGAVRDAARPGRVAATDGAFTRCRGRRARVRSRRSARRTLEASRDGHHDDRLSSGVRLYYELHGAGAAGTGPWVLDRRHEPEVRGPPGWRRPSAWLVYDRRGHSRSERPDAAGQLSTRTRRRPRGTARGARPRARASW